MEAHGASQDRGDSGSQVGFASAVAGSSLPGSELSLHDLARLFLSLSGSREQWDAVVSSAFSTAAVSGAGLVPGSVALELVAAPSVCSSGHVSAMGVASPAGGASASGSSSQRESPFSERRRKHLSSMRGPSRVRGIMGVSLLPLPALLVWLAHPPPLRRTGGRDAPSPCWSSWRRWWSLWA